MSAQATIPQVMNDPSVRNRVKVMLEQALLADPVDAYLDAVLVAQLLKARMEKQLGE